MAYLARLSRMLDLACQAVITVLTLVGIGSVAIGIFGRSLGISNSWTEELARYSMIWVIYLGAAVAMARSTHIRMELLQPVMPAGAWQFINRFQLLISLVFVVTITAIGVGFVVQLQQLDQRSPLLGVPMYVMYASVPLSFALMAVHMLKDLLGGSAPTGFMEGDPAAVADRIVT
jgi:TRAP-type C4-dicarboxylate transport system permease small subunit